MKKPQNQKWVTKVGEPVALTPVTLGAAWDYRMLLVSNENWVGKAMLALRPKGSKS